MSQTALQRSKFVEITNRFHISEPLALKVAKGGAAELSSSLHGIENQNLQNSKFEIGRPHIGVVAMKIRKHISSSKCPQNVTSFWEQWVCHWSDCRNCSSLFYN